MTDKLAKWQRQEQAVRATQMAFDLSSEVQKTIKKQKQTDVILIEQEMSEVFGHQITVEAKTKQKGCLQISYKTSDELETIISKLLN